MRENKAVGRSISVSPFRRLVTELMHASQQVPSVVIERRMDLRPLIQAREACSPRPNWTVLFTKAYAMLGRDYPMLRWSYLKFPWPRFYEHPHTIATLNVERRLENEDVVLHCLIRSPENRSLVELDETVRQYKEAPVESLRSYRRAVAMSHVPWPFRRLFWWASLNVFGRRRCHNFGTFGISSVASLGAGLLHLVPVLTSTLHYGLIDEQGRLDMRLAWDHRVMDGATVARVLKDYELILKGEIVNELAGMSRRSAAA